MSAPSPESLAPSREAELLAKLREDGDWTSSPHDRLSEATCIRLLLEYGDQRAREGYRDGYARGVAVFTDHKPELAASDD